MNVNITKLLILVTLLICSTILLALGKIEEATFSPIIYSVIGFVMGNGKRMIDKK